MAASAMQERISRNVRVLMAVRQIAQQQELARMLGWRPDDLTRRLQGRWKVDHLTDLAKVFGVSEADLLSDVAQLVSAAGDAQGREWSKKYYSTDNRHRQGADVLFLDPARARKRRDVNPWERAHMIKSV